MRAVTAGDIYAGAAVHLAAGSLGDVIARALWQGWFH